MVYQGDAPYVFVSYSHADKEKVENLLRFLNRTGVRFWYDGEIRTGDSWSEFIDQRLDNSKRFLLFLSNGIEQRPEIIRELKKAKAKYDADPKNYKIIIVVMEYVPVEHIFRNEPKLLDLFAKIQYIFVPKYGGITLEFLRRFLSRSIWPDELRDESLLTDDRLNAKIAISDDELLEINDYSDVISRTRYVYPLARPEKYQEDGLSFYKVRIGETDKNAVYPICMDNQWCPQKLLYDDHFIKNGFNDSTIQSQREDSQFIEICRSLLHNWQLIINRSSVFNTKSITNLYYKNEESKKAFCQLLENGSIVIFLYNERLPIEKPMYAHDSDVFAEWEDICRHHLTYCIRMDWEDDENNRIEANKKLSTQFNNMLLCLADDKYRLNTLCDLLNIDKENRDQFRNLWKDIRCSILEKNGGRTIDELVSYNREDFYNKYLIKSKTKANECLLDYHKQFVRELKQIVDLCYSFNLPNAIGVQPIVDYNNPLKVMLFNEQGDMAGSRVLSVEELYCAVISFVPTFINETMYVLDNARIKLEDISKIRNFTIWKEYMKTIDSGRKRSNLNEIDFYDMEKIWVQYFKLMKQCKEKFSDWSWRECAGSLSVIYRFGQYELVTIYRSDSDEVLIKEHSNQTTFSKARDILTIDFVCSDITEIDVENNCFISVQRLFSGKALETSKYAYDKILSAMKENKYRIITGETR